MEFQLKKEAKKYVRPYKSKIRFAKKHWKMMYHLMVSSGQEFLSIHQSAALEDLHRYWGSPLEIADSFAEAIGKEEVLKCYHRSRKICIIAISLFLLLLLVLLWIYLWNHSTLTVIEISSPQ